MRRIKSPRVAQNVTVKTLHSDVLQSQFIPFTHLNSPSVFESKNGQVGMVIRVEGVAFDTALACDVNAWRRTLLSALSQLDERFCVWQTTHRHLASHTLRGSFPNAFARALDAAYHTRFQGQNLYVNDLYLTIVYKGISSGKVGKGLSLFNRLKHAAIKEARAITRIAHMQHVQQAVAQLCVSLKVFRPTVLGANDLYPNASSDNQCKDKRGNNNNSNSGSNNSKANATSDNRHDSAENKPETSELIQFLSLWMNAGIPQSLPSTAHFPAIGTTYADTQKKHTLYPNGHLAQYLSRNRLFFGTAIQFDDAVSGNRQFGAMISIKQYGNTTVSTMLDNLLSVDCEFIATHSFALENKAQSLKHIHAHGIKLSNAGDEALSQQFAFADASDSIASGDTQLGYHHNTLMVLARTQIELDTRVHHIIQCYADAGFTAVRESIGLIPAFWSQLPTNQHCIARASLITLDNFVDCAPLHNYPSGFFDGNHLGSCVTLLETPSKTPVFFNYHVKGHKNNPSKGHALIIGGNDSGKTALMSFMDAQMQRYGGSTFYFDRDQGAKIYILASGGHYAILSPNFPQTSQFNPFQLPDTPENRGLCHTLLLLLCKSSEEDEISADDSEQLKRCVDYAYDMLAPHFRQLSTLTQLLPQHFSHWPALRRWLKGQGQFPDGEYAYLFDNARDALTLKTMMGFDMTHFLDNEPTHVRTPLMLYLLHRVKQSLDGRRVSILLDEGWQYFIDNFWMHQLEKLLPTLRKTNAHVVIATQSPSSVLKSPLASMLLDNMPTHIFFANPQATKRDYIAGFQLTESEFQHIAHTPPEKRIFLTKQEHRSVLCQLHLGHLPHYLAVLSGNKASVQVVDRLREKQGDAPEQWLPAFYDTLKGDALKEDGLKKEDGR